MSLAFWKAYTSKKVQRGHSELMAALAAFDPNDFEDAAVFEKSSQLDDFGVQLAQLEQKRDAAKGAFDVAEKLNVQRLAAIEYLQAKLNDPAHSSEHDEIAKAVEVQLKTVEDAQAELAEFKQARDETSEDVADMRKLYDEKAQQMLQRRQKIEQAQRELGRAERTHDRIEDRKRTAEVKAKLRQDDSGDAADAALAAMERKKAALEAETRAAELKINALKPADHETENKHIAEAMAAASGSPTHPLSVEERLAAVKAASAARK